MLLNVVTLFFEKEKCSSYSYQLHFYEEIILKENTNQIYL